MTCARYRFESESLLIEEGKAKKVDGQVIETWTFRKLRGGCKADALPLSHTPNKLILRKMRESEIV